MIKEITTHIQENTVGFTIGVNLFAGYVPSTITGDHVVVIETGGAVKPELEDYMDKTVQVLSVASDYQTARDNALKVYELLHSEAGITLPIVVIGKEFYANTISAISSPQSLGQDSKGRFIISTNYILRIQNS
jgi:hypothetical protein